MLSIRDTRRQYCACVIRQPRPPSYYSQRARVGSGNWNETSIVMRHVTSYMQSKYKHTDSLSDTLIYSGLVKTLERTMKCFILLVAGMLIFSHMIKKKAVMHVHDCLIMASCCSAQVSIFSDL